MPLALHRDFNPDQSKAGTQKEPIVRLAKLLALSAVLIAGAYFAVLFFVTSR